MRDDLAVDADEETLPHFIAGVLSGFPPHDQEHPEERLDVARAVLAALDSEGFVVVPRAVLGTKETE
jgi:hypothetical protein